MGKHLSKKRMEEIRDLAHAARASSVYKRDVMDLLYEIFLLERENEQLEKELNRLEEALEP